MSKRRIGTAGVVLIPILTAALLTAHPSVTPLTPQIIQRPSVLEAGTIVGVLTTGPLNAIADVPGVLVGHTTIVRGENIRSRHHNNEPWPYGGGTSPRTNTRDTTQASRD